MATSASHGSGTAADAKPGFWRRLWRALGPSYRPTPDAVPTSPDAAFASPDAAPAVTIAPADTATKGTGVSDPAAGEPTAGAVAAGAVPAGEMAAGGPIASHEAGNATTITGVVLHGRFCEPREHETVADDDVQIEHEEGTMELDEQVATEGTEQVATEGTGGAEVVDPTGVTLTGRITTVSGLVLAGASVSVLGLDGMSAGTATTEADGVYHLTGIPGGVYAVAAQLAPHRPAAALLSLGAGHAVLDLALTGRGTLRGRVVTGLAGIALPDVPVRLVGPDGRTVATVFSAVDGQYRFTGIDEGTWAVTVQSPRYREVTLEATVAADEDTVVDVVLVGNGTVRGQISSPGSTPLSGSRVLLLDATGAVQGSVLTDSSGHYDFGEVVTGVYSVVVLDLTPSVGTVEVTASEVATCDLRVRDLSPTVPTATVGPTTTVEPSTSVDQATTSTAGEVSP